MQPPLPLPSRARRLERLIESPHEVLVVGGGITGCGVALDLALRGLRVALVERGDWACGTSSASSRLIHGGLRYLEQLELGLVREACLERQRLLSNAAGLVWPERFLFPLRRGGRVGRLKLAAGLGLYTLLSLPRPLGLPRLVSREAARGRLPGIQSEGLLGAGSYLDATTDDARLTLAVVASAVEAGALAVSRLEALGIEAAPSGVELRLLDALGGEELSVRARRVVLAGGPWTDGLRGRAGLAGRWVRPTRGTHIVVPRQRLPTDGAVIFPCKRDGRVLFLLPWPRYTVIGTTDLDAEPDEAPMATREEVDYLLEAANALLGPPELVEGDVVSSWAGLRPLLAAEGRSPSERSREERIRREGPIYTIAGGKLTAFRKMAEDLGARIASDLGLGRPGRRSPSRAHKLRGALAAPVERPSWSSLGPQSRPATDPDPLATAWSRRYGALGPAVAELCERVEGGRHPLDPETVLGEVDWAVTHEDCQGAVDFFFRRTDLGFGPAEAAHACAGTVLDRLARELGWSPSRRREEETGLAGALERSQAWRRAAPPPENAPSGHGEGRFPLESTGEGPREGR